MRSRCATAIEERGGVRAGSGGDCACDGRGDEVSGFGHLDALDVGVSGDVAGLADGLNVGAVLHVHSQGLVCLALFG